MDTPDARLRRPIATTSPSHPSEPGTLKSHPQSLLSRYHTLRASSSLPQRAALRAIELVLLSFSLFIVPAAIHHVVRSLNTLYEVTGRRARTTFDDVGAGSVVLGAAVLVLWHGVLIALGYKTVGRRDGAWSRVLSRVLIPVYLVGAMVGFVWKVAGRMGASVAVPSLYNNASSPLDVLE